VLTAQVDTVDDVLKKYKGRETDLFKALEKKWVAQLARRRRCHLASVAPTDEHDCAPPAAACPSLAVPCGCAPLTASLSLAECR
jgi:hypothetical protein